MVDPAPRRVRAATDGCSIRSGIGSSASTSGAAGVASLATLVTHYWANDGFLRGEAKILDRMDRLRDIPGLLVHGRHDISSPVLTPWRLSRLWPASRLHIVETEGHGGPEMNARMRQGLDAFARCG